MVWREVENFSSGGVCLVMAFTGFDKADDHDDYDRFAAAMVRRRDRNRWVRRLDGVDPAQAWDAIGAGFGLQSASAIDDVSYAQTVRRRLASSAASR